AAASGAAGAGVDVKSPGGSSGEGNKVRFTCPACIALNETETALYVIDRGSVDGSAQNRVWRIDLRTGSTGGYTTPVVFGSITDANGFSKLSGDGWSS